MRPPSLSGSLGLEGAADRTEELSSRCCRDRHGPSRHQAGGRAGVREGGREGERERGRRRRWLVPAPERSPGALWFPCAQRCAPQPPFSRSPSPVLPDRPPPTFNPFPPPRGWRLRLTLARPRPLRFHAPFMAETDRGRRKNEGREGGKGWPCGAEHRPRAAPRTRLCTHAHKQAHTDIQLR